MNRIDGIVRSRRGEAGVQAVQVACGSGSFEALVFERPGRSPWLEPGRPVRVAFKESDVLLAPRGQLPWAGGIEARVVSMTPYEILGRVDLQCGGARILVLSPLTRLVSLGIVPGMQVDAWVPPHEIVLEERIADGTGSGAGDRGAARTEMPAGSGTPDHPLTRAADKGRGGVAVAMEGRR